MAKVEPRLQSKVYLMQIRHTTLTMLNKLRNTSIGGNELGGQPPYTFSHDTSSLEEAIAAQLPGEEMWCKGKCGSRR
eukprot:6203477-Pleurochrysis_carterae.AAC.1